MHTIEPPTGNVLKVKVSGKLTREEYADLVPSWEQIIGRHGKFRLIFEMEPGFEGWEPMAAWDDMKFTVSHRNELERVAMVGEKKWQEFATKLGKLLAGCDVRFFPREEMATAERWVEE
jgi:hypothetical protein